MQALVESDIRESFGTRASRSSPSCRCRTTSCSPSGRTSTRSRGATRASPRAGTCDRARRLARRRGAARRELERLAPQGRDLQPVPHAAAADQVVMFSARRAGAAGGARRQRRHLHVQRPHVPGDRPARSSGGAVGGAAERARARAHRGPGATYAGVRRRRARRGLRRPPGSARQRAASGASGSSVGRFAARPSPEDRPVSRRPIHGSTNSR